MRILSIQCWAITIIPSCEHTHTHTHCMCPVPLVNDNIFIFRVATCYEFILSASAYTLRTRCPHYGSWAHRHTHTHDRAYTPQPIHFHLWGGHFNFITTLPYLPVLFSFLFFVAFCLHIVCEAVRYFSLVILLLIVEFKFIHYD